MPDPLPPPTRPKTFAEKLAERPRARFFTVFTILGFAVTPAAVAILLVRAPGAEAPGSSTGGSGIRIEAILAALLIAAHLLCAYLAWSFWRDETAVPTDESQPTDPPTDR